MINLLWWYIWVVFYFSLLWTMLWLISFYLNLCVVHRYCLSFNYIKELLGQNGCNQNFRLFIHFAESSQWPQCQNTKGRTEIGGTISCCQFKCQPLYCCVYAENNGNKDGDGGDGDDNIYSGRQHWLPLSVILHDFLIATYKNSLVSCSNSHIQNKGGSKMQPSHSFLPNNGINNILKNSASEWLPKCKNHGVCLQRDFWLKKEHHIFIEVLVPLLCPWQSPPGS